MRICILLLFISQLSFGQNDSVLERRIYLKFAPLSLIPVYIFPSVRVGAEYRFKNPLAIYGEFGAYVYKSKGFSGKLEFKYYFSETFVNNSRETSANYFSAELYFKHQKYDTYDSITPDPIDGETGFPKTNYSVSKNVECFTIKYGQMLVFNCGFTVDAFVGLGIRIKQATNTLSAEENYNMPATSDYGPNLFINRAGNFIYPNFDEGIKIGWRVSDHSRRKTKKGQ